MIPRPAHLQRLHTAIRRSPITALLGPRQVGKTTLARQLAAEGGATYFDLESEPDLQRLQNPHLALGALKGLVIIDEVQVKPELFKVLRVLADRPGNQARFVILGSASTAVVRQVSESLAGRVELIELQGFGLDEVGVTHWQSLWLRGGFPRSFLAGSEEDSLAWRENLVRTFLERDIPQLGITVPAAALRRFWTMLTHGHGQLWNASRLARAMGLSDKTVRGYLNLLTGTFIVRQLQPWFENLGKRQVKAPKVYLRDSGLLHSLLGLDDRLSLLGHPVAGASWEGFVIEQILGVSHGMDAYFWATHGGAELDLLVLRGGRRVGFEIKLSEAPTLTRAMHVAIEDLDLDHLYVVYPGEEVFPMHERVTAWPVVRVPELAR